MIEWMFYPKSKKVTDLAIQVIESFKKAADEIDSSIHELDSNAVLNIVAGSLQVAGFRVETGKKTAEKVSVPVLFGLNGKMDKCFDADAYAEVPGFVVEVEAGRAVVNHQFLKDLFQACMMHDVKYLAISVRRFYKGNRDFEKVCIFFDTLYASNRLRLPLEGVLIIGY